MDQWRTLPFHEINPNSVVIDVCFADRRQCYHSSILLHTYTWLLIRMKTRISDANSDLSSLRGPFHWACCMLDSGTPINSGWWRGFNARDVAQLPMWVGSTADGGSVCCLRTNVSFNSHE